MTWPSLAIVAVAALAVSVGWRLTMGRRGAGRHDWSWLRVGLGLATVLVAVLMGGILIGVRSDAPPEQHGIGVLIWPTGGSADDGWANPVSVSGTFEVKKCGEPVLVRLTVSPSADFWSKHWAALRDGGNLALSVPDAELSGVSASTTDGGLEAVISPVPADDLPGATTIRRSVDPDEATGTTTISVEMPDWGLDNRAVAISFSADWTHERSRLGSCFVVMPALAGLTTALSAAQIAGLATSDPLDIPGQPNFLTVSSGTPEQHAYYRARYEVTRGVSTLLLGENTLTDSGYGPSPNANLSGNNAWTCRSTRTDSTGAVNGRLPATSLPDLLVSPDQGTYSISDQRLDEILAQQNCATFVAIDESGAGTRRDLLLIMIGALFSFGVELFLSGFRRREPAVTRPA